MEMWSNGEMQGWLMPFRSLGEPWAGRVLPVTPRAGQQRSHGLSSIPLAGRNCCTAHPPAFSKGKGCPFLPPALAQAPVSRETAAGRAAEEALELAGLRSSTSAQQPARSARCFSAPGLGEQGEKPDRKEKAEQACAASQPRPCPVSVQAAPGNTGIFLSGSHYTRVPYMQYPSGERCPSCACLCSVLPCWECPVSGKNPSVLWVLQGGDVFFWAVTETPSLWGHPESRSSTQKADPAPGDKWTSGCYLQESREHGGFTGVSVGAGSKPSKAAGHRGLSPQLGCWGTRSCSLLPAQVPGSAWVFASL
ncbi:uncharacterized protein M6G45_012113 isoform 1-T2 [Spheniscus humboldti]